MNTNKDTGELLRYLNDVPNFILTCIDIGKKLGLLSLLQDAQETVSMDKCHFLFASIDVMMRSQMSRMFGVPDNIHKVARAFGHDQSTMGDFDNGSNSGRKCPFTFCKSNNLP